MVFSSIEPFDDQREPFNDLALMMEGTYHERLFRGPSTNDMRK